VRSGWQWERLCPLLAAGPSLLQRSFGVELTLRRQNADVEIAASGTLTNAGGAIVTPLRAGLDPESVQVAWMEVVEMSLPSALAT
jgi:hypothetical protein